MFVVGLTGGVGSGKSTTASFFQDLDIDVIDADQLAREAVLPGTEAHEKIICHFGDSAIKSDGTLNREYLRDKIFSDASHKSWLENLLHPIIHKLAKQKLEASKSSYSIYMAPLLIENKVNNLVNHVLIVDLPESLQLERASARDGQNKNEIQKVIDSQATRKERNAKADDIITNDGSIENLKQQVYNLHNKFLNLAKSHDN